MLYHGPVSVEAFFLYGPRSYEASYIAYLKQMISFGPFFLFWIFFHVWAFFGLGLNGESRANTALLLSLVLYTYLQRMRCCFVCLGLFFILVALFDIEI